MSVRKIVVIGPESTGKSTLCAALAEALQTVWVPEYAREYLTNLRRNYMESDLLEIARGQITAENLLLQKADRFLICDTNLYVHKVWSEHSFHNCHRWMLEQLATRRYDLYLLTNIDMAWEYDPLREHGSDYWRNYFYLQYKDIVINSGVPWTMVSGAHNDRLDTAIKAIESLCN